MSWKKPMWVLLLLVGFAGQLFAIDDSLQVITLHQEKFEWMIEKDMEALEKVLAEDVVYIHSNGWVEYKPDILENIQSGRLEYRQVDIREQSVQLYGSVAIVKGLAEFYVALEGSPLRLDLLYTETYHFSEGKWVLVHRHACRPVVE